MKRPTQPRHPDNLQTNKNKMFCNNPPAKYYNNSCSLVWNSFPSPMLRITPRKKTIGGERKQRTADYREVRPRQPFILLSMKIRSSAWCLWKCKTRSHLPTIEKRPPNRGWRKTNKEYTNIGNRGTFCTRIPAKIFICLGVRSGVPCLPLMK